MNHVNGSLSQWQIAPFHIGSAIGPMGSAGIPIIFAILMGAFDVDRATLSLALPAYMLPYALVQLVSGSISDLTSRRSSIVYGFAIYGGFTLLAGLAPNFEVFIFSQIMQGATNAFTTPILMATLGDVMPDERTGRTMGLFSTVNMSGMMIAPLMAGVLAGFNWRWIYITVAIITWGLTIWYVAWFRHYGDRVPARPRAATLRADLQNIGQAFGLTLVLLALLAFLANGSMRGPSYLLGEYMRDIWGSGEGSIGIAVGLFGFGAVVFGPFSGLIIERIGVLWGVALSMLGVAAALFFLGIVPTPFWFAVGNFLLGVAGIAAWAALNTLVVQAMPSHRGTASSIFGSTKFLAQAISPLWFTPLFETSLPASIFHVAGLMAVLLFIPLLIIRGRVRLGHTAVTRAPAS